MSLADGIPDESFCSRPFTDTPFFSSHLTALDISLYDAPWGRLLVVDESINGAAVSSR